MSASAPSRCGLSTGACRSAWHESADLVTLLSSVASLDDTPVDLYLSRTAPSAVDVFAKRHETELAPRQARYYKELIPVGRPQAGQQLGFEVDLDACTGCKACVAACHSLNGLDDSE